MSYNNLNSLPICKPRRHLAADGDVHERARSVLDKWGILVFSLQ